MCGDSFQVLAEYAVTTGWAGVPKVPSYPSFLLGGWAAGVTLVNMRSSYNPTVDPLLMFRYLRGLLALRRLLGLRHPLIAVADCNEKPQTCVAADN